MLTAHARAHTHTPLLLLQTTAQQTKALAERLEGGSKNTAQSVQELQEKIQQLDSEEKKVCARACACLCKRCGQHVVSVAKQWNL